MHFYMENVREDLLIEKKPKFKFDCCVGFSSESGLAFSRPSARFLINKEDGIHIIY